MMKANHALATISPLALTVALGCSAVPPPSGETTSAGSAGAASTAGAGGTTILPQAGSTSAGAGGGGAPSGNAGSGGSAPAGGIGGMSGAGSVGGAAGSASGAGAGGSGGSGNGGEMKSAGCGKTRMLQDGTHSLSSGGAQRTYALRVPANYDSAHPYHLMLGFHGATGSSKDIAPSYFGLWDLSEGSTIFAAPDAVQGLWNAETDTALVSDMLTELEANLCIDTSHVGIEGFSQGGAMVWTLACALPGKFAFAVVHSGGGLAMPKTCQPLPFFSSLGHDGSGQGMSSDFFAMTNGCKVESLPLAPTGGHACTDYQGCSAGHPTRWCAYDGGHTPSPTDAGQGKSWMPEEVWTFVKQF
ncbi:MAG TPA: hypothetical protein VHB79_23455 [Polyangiaceae bacterium]|nr:hypothetical protein [Polyangiaceae bacterium]